MTISNQVAIAEGLFTWPSENPKLLASRCDDCGIADFPAKKSCPACCGQNVHIEELPTRGTLWTWTIQDFMPKPPYKSDESPESFQPYGIGYLELPGAVRVEGRLLENDPGKLQIGMEMDVVFEKYRSAENGDDIISFFFKPVRD